MTRVVTMVAAMLTAAIAAGGVPAAEQAELRAIVNSTRSDIVFDPLAHPGPQ